MRDFFLFCKIQKKTASGVRTSHHVLAMEKVAE